MPAQLLALTGGEPILLDRPVMLFGRHPECDIQLNSRKVSRRHCCIAQVNDYLVVRDLGSTNGVRINNERVVEGRLKDGDELTIGNFRYQVCWDAPGGGAAAQARPVRGVPATSDADDELLESCDDPVPLSEPLPPVKPAAAAKTPERPPERAKPPASTTAPKPPTTSNPGGFRIPDDIGLAPGPDTMFKSPLRSEPLRSEADSSIN
jgi:predicted component of type VI protein secretion system